MSYSYAIQARVWDHMTKLEETLKQQAPVPAAIPTNFVEALRLALEKAEEVERVQAVVAAQVIQIEHKDAQIAIAAHWTAQIKRGSDRL